MRAIGAVIMAFIVLAALSCGGKDDNGPSATPSPAGSPTVSQPTATPGPILPDVRLVPAALPLFQGEEMAEPFAGLISPANWRMYIATAQGQPELVYETGRFMSIAAWPVNDVLMLIFASQATSLGRPPDRGGPPPPYDISGIHILGLGGSPPSRTEFLFEGRYGSDLLSPDGKRLAVNHRDEKGIDSAYIVDPDRGSVFLLDGLGTSASILDWTIDGRGVIASGGNGTYYVQLDGAATRISDLPLRHVSVSPGGQRFAFIEGSEIHVFDRSTGQKKQVTSGGEYEPNGPTPAWSADGKELFFPSEIIDASTGRTVASVLPRQLSLWSALSPDGRYFLAIEQGASGDLKGSCESPERSRMLLWDRLTGSTRTVIDCGQPLFRPRWLSDSRHAALHVPNCWGCDPGRTRVLLLDVETAEVRPLNSGLERDSYAFPSPQGQTLVTGDRLRLYSAEGMLLREIEPPPGLHFTGAAWSPDGKRFVYIVGPAFSLL